MNFWLCIASDYQAVHVALCQRDRSIDSTSAHKNDSNKLLLTLIKELLAQHKLTLQDLSFIGINLGPGPYTSLRIAITTANGLAYATSCKLVGVDSLYALLEEYNSTEHPTTIALLNAFNQDLFYGIKHKDKDPITGYQNVDQLLTTLQETIEEPICFVGNGVELYKEKIIAQFSHAYIPDPLPEYASLSSLIKQGWDKWQKQECADQVYPLYLKELHYKNSIKVT